jgi:hypothetical protein
MIPGLLQRLREGLQRIGYPPELTQRFFDHLITLHRAAVQDGHDAGAQAAADAAWAEPSKFSDSAQDEVQMWLDQTEAQESGYVGADGEDLAAEHVAAPEAAQQEALEARRAAERTRAAARSAAMAQPQAAAPQAVAETTAAAAAADAGPEDLRIGTWVEIWIKGTWVRAELTWSSPHATLFMFTSIGGAAHSMSRRTLERLRATGQVRVVAHRPVIDEALDQVAQAALKNSL